MEIQGINYDLVLAQDGIFYVGVQRLSKGKGKFWVALPGELKEQLIESIKELNKKA